MLAIATLLAVVFISLLITRIATVALTATGLSREASRFQARSALSGVGYTTSESEHVVNHPVRRRIVLLLMLVSNAGLVTIVASMMLSFVGTGDTASLLWRVALLFAGLLLLWLLARSETVDRHLSRVIARALTRWTDLQVRDYVRLLQLTKEYGITELQVQPDDWLANRSLGELKLRDEGVVVLGIERGADYLGVPRGHTVLRPGDVLVLYGRASTLAELDRRHREAGDIEHQRAVAEHRRIAEQQQDAPIHMGDAQ